MSEPQIVCIKCRTPIRLTDSLAASLLAKTRKQFEQRLAQQEIGFAKRETELRKQKDELAKTRKAIDEAVAKKLASARTTIAKPRRKKPAGRSPAISRSATASSPNCSRTRRQRHQAGSRAKGASGGAAQGP